MECGKKSFDELLREKMQTIFSHAIERQMPKAAPQPSLDSANPHERKKAIDKEKEKARHDRYAKSEKGRESQRRRNARWLAKPGNKEIKKQSRHNWYIANREHELEKVKRYRQDNPGHYARYQKEHRAWIKANDPEKYAQILEREHRYREQSRTKNPGKSKEYQSKWLAKFKAENGMSYSTYIYKVKHGQMEGIDNGKLSQGI